MNTLETRGLETLDGAVIGISGAATWYPSHVPLMLEDGSVIWMPIRRLLASISGYWTALRRQK